MIFISAGHHLKDPGAVSNGYQENKLAIEFRNLVIAQLNAKGAKYISDNDNETLGQYLSRIKTGNGSVVIEFHFDAAATKTATGCTALIEAEADRLDNAFAKELANTTSSTLGIRNRGVISELQSHRGKLGLMREDGIICLLELGFITNTNDMAAYNANKYTLANKIAEILVRYDNLI